MEKFTSLLEKCLLPIANKLSSNSCLKAISNGFSILLPITMIGAIFTLLANLQIAPYQALITSLHLKEIFTFAPTVTTDMLAIYAVFFIAKSMSDELGLDKHSSMIGGLSLFAFLLVIPLGVSGVAKVSGEAVNINGALSTLYLGSAGLFTAMILGLIVPHIYNVFIKNNIVIKLPDQVPPTISKSFSALLPAFAIAFLFGLIRFGFSLTPYGHLNNFIYTMIKIPLSTLGASPLTFIIFILMCSLMWFFGLHGGMIVMPFLTALYTTAGLENLAAFSAGTPLPHMITQANWLLYASLGGAGGTVGLCIIMFFKAKSARYKALGKLALPAGLCGINEPITFGLPMVLNTIMIIPLIITPIITFIVSYICMAIGLVPFPNGVSIPMGTPVVFSGLIAVGWQGAILQIILIIIQLLIYYPFFNVLDRQAYEEEQSNNGN
ncbi:MAG: PTS transporter subunit EIIC [Erysipelotrichaceae bacterium]|nr:PTS transporter subunit EIIC [Erysipelotrichaceae bacterium]MDY5251139.1 PTS transporter subunit EIIC [Erysipelotrichaceae bacterium]